MKKYFLLWATAAMTATLSLTSCSDDDDAPKLVPVETSEGVFVVNSGNQSGGIEGSLTYYDYATATARQTVYKNANGEGLGVTSNHAVVYGSKIYIIGGEEKTVFVADRKTLKKITNITAKVNGETAQPREAVAGYGHVYVSTYNNAVIAIDTLTNAIDKTYECGYYTEGMALHNGMLYTADSNYGRGKQDNASPSISQINLTTGKTTIFTHDKINNPIDVKIVGGRLFFLDSGSYDENWNQIGAGLFELANGDVKFIADATAMAVSNTKVFFFNAPYTYPTTTPTYKVFDTTTNAVADFCNGTDIASPNKISTDPVKGYVYITSYVMGDYGYAEYRKDGYCVIYNATGSKEGQFDCGVGAGYVIPNTSIEYVQQ